MLMDMYPEIEVSAWVSLRKNLNFEVIFHKNQRSFEND